MDDEKKKPVASHSGDLPSLLPFHDAILIQDSVRIVEDSGGLLETDAMFALVREILSLVPLEQDYLLIVVSRT